MLSQYEPLIKLTVPAEEEFAKFIQTQRKLLIKSPKDAAAIAMKKHQQLIETLLDKRDVSN